MSKPLEAELYSGRVELRRGANHVYRARVEGGRSYVVQGVTNAIKMVDKSRTLMPWQQKVIAFVVNEHAQPMLNLVKQAAADRHFRIRPDAIDRGIKAMVRAVHTATDDVRDEAGDVGTQVHAYVEDYMLAAQRKQAGDNAVRAPGTTGLASQVRRACHQFAKWFVDNEVEVHEVERLVFSIDHWYSGQLDYLLTVAGNKGVWDAKTGKGVYPEVLLQRSAYKAAWDEEYPNDEPLGPGGILFFQREEVNPRVKVLSGEFEPIALPDTHERDFAAFLACMTLKKFDSAAYKELQEARQ